MGGVSGILWGFGVETRQKLAQAVKFYPEEQARKWEGTYMGSALKVGSLFVFFKGATHILGYQQGYDWDKPTQVVITVLRT